MPLFKKSQHISTPEINDSAPRPREVPTNEYDLMIASLSYALVALTIPSSTFANQSSFPKEVAWDAEMMMANKQIHDTAPAVAEPVARQIGELLARTTLELKGWNLPPEGWSADSLFANEKGAS